MALRLCNNAFLAAKVCLNTFPRYFTFLRRVKVSNFPEQIVVERVCASSARSLARSPGV